MISSTCPLAAASMTCSIFMDSITSDLLASCALRRLRCTSMLTIVPCIGALSTAPSVRVPAVTSALSAARTRLLAVMQDRERIARIDARTRQRGLARTRLRVQARMPAVARSKLARMPLDERGIDFVRLHRRMTQQVLQEPDVRRDAFDAELAQRAIRALHDVGEVVRSTNARSPSRAANRSSATFGTRRSRSCRREHPDPRAARMRSACRSSAASSRRAAWTPC